MLIFSSKSPKSKLLQAIQLVLHILFDVSPVVEFYIYLDIIWLYNFFNLCLEEHSFDDLRKQVSTAKSWISV